MGRWSSLFFASETNPTAAWPRKRSIMLRTTSLGMLSLYHLVSVRGTNVACACLIVFVFGPQDVQEMEQLEYQLQRDNELTRQQIEKSIAER